MATAPEPARITTATAPVPPASAGVLEAVLEATSEAIIVIDELGGIAQFNRRFCEMWGVPVEALEFESAIAVCSNMVEQLNDPEDAKTRLFQLMASPTPPEPQAIEFADGRIIEYCWKPQLVGGVPCGGVLAFRDISETRKAHGLLSDEVWVNAGLARIRSQLGWSADTSVMLHRLCAATTEILECDASHTYLWSADENAFLLVAGHGDNEEQWQLLQSIRPSRAMVSDLLCGFDHDEIAEVEIAKSEAALNDGVRNTLGVERTLFMALRSGDETIGFHSACIRTKGTYFNDRQRRLARGTGQLVSLALENTRLVQELARANRRKEEFVTALSHELRTPLHVILGYTSVLLADERDIGRTEPRELIRRIDRSGRQLAAMLEDSLVAGIDPEITDVHRSAVCIADVLRDVELDTREARQEAGLAYSWNIATDLPVLHSDGDKIRLIVKNLVSNAVKFTDVGGVFVKATAQKNGIEIAVEDTGVGIGVAAQKIIFEPFRQLDRTAGRILRGTGLGLHVVRRMVDLLGGRIDVESAPGKGATFRVWLPAPGV
ncbi:MAG: ATP-binding protein [Deltaproteobacteria bacterium]